MPRRGKRTAIQLLNHELANKLQLENNNTTQQMEPPRQAISTSDSGGAISKIKPVKEVKTNKRLPKIIKKNKGPINTRILLTK